MGEFGPLPNPNARRRNKRPEAAAVEQGAPRMPVKLSAEAKAEWRRVVPVLAKIGILATVDRQVLIRYCEAWSEWLELAELIGKSGKLLRGRDGGLVRNPAWLLRRDVARDLDTLAAQLGVTPTARLRNNIKHELPAPEESDKVTDLAEFRKRIGV